MILHSLANVIKYLGPSICTENQSSVGGPRKLLNSPASSPPWTRPGEEVQGPLFNLHLPFHSTSWQSIPQRLTLFPSNRSASVSHGHLASSPIWFLGLCLAPKTQY